MTNESRIVDETIGMIIEEVDNRSNNISLNETEKSQISSNVKNYLKSIENSFQIDPKSRKENPYVRSFHNKIDTITSQHLHQISQSQQPNPQMNFESMVNTQKYEETDPKSQLDQEGTEHQESLLSPKTTKRRQN